MQLHGKRVDRGNLVELYEITLIYHKTFGDRFDKDIVEDICGSLGKTSTVDPVASISNSPGNTSY